MGPGRFDIIPCTTASEENQKLEQVLEKLLPESVHVLNLLRLARNPRLPKEVRIEIYIYRDDETKDEDDTFVVCIERPNFHTTKSIITLPPQNLTKPKIEAYDALIGWNEPQAFQCTPPRIWDALRSLCEFHGKIILSKDGDGIPVIVYAITDLEKAKNLEVKDITSDNPSITLRSLKKSDVEQVVGLWKYAMPHAKKVVELCVETLPSVGVFKNGEMASCVTLSPLGMCNLLHTIPIHRGKGLGQFVMRWITREIAREIGTLPMAEAENENIPSNTAITKSGYEMVFYGKNYYYEPK